MATWGTRWFGMLLLGVIALSFKVTAQPANAASDRPTPTMPERAGSLPIVAEHRYRMAAKIRPLLFWIGRDNVGEARVIRRGASDGAVGLELLIGSDPTRAPRRINRWGYISEEMRGTRARLLGVMKQSDEQSLDEAKSRLAGEAQGRQYVFKAIRGTTSANEASSTIATIRLTRDLTFRDVDALLNLIDRDLAGGSVRRVPLPSGVRPGFLVALTELIHRSVTAVGEPTGRVPARGAVSLPYIYNGTLCDLTLRTSARLREVRLGRRSFPDVVRARFEARNRATGETTDFELLYGASGPLAEIPVHAVYQPRWWFQVELFLDEADQF